MDLIHGRRVIQFTALFIRTASKVALDASQQARLQWLRTRPFLYPVYPSRNQWNWARKSTPELELNVLRSCCVFYTIGKPRKSPQKKKFNDWGRLFLPAKSLELLGHALFKGKVIEGKTLATHFTVGNAYLLNHSGLWDCTHNLQGNRQIWALGLFPRIKNSTYLLSFLAKTRQVYTYPFSTPPPLTQQSIVPAVPIHTGQLTENVIQLELVNFPVSQTLCRNLLLIKKTLFFKVED